MCDDSAFNIKFVEYIEQYPCIYDFTRDDHSKRNVTEKAWNLIGKEFKLSGIYILFNIKELLSLFISMKKPKNKYVRKT